MLPRGDARRASFSESARVSSPQLSAAVGFASFMARNPLLGPQLARGRAPVRCSLLALLSLGPAPLRSRSARFSAAGANVPSSNSVLVDNQGIP